MKRRCKKKKKKKTNNVPGRGWTDNQCHKKNISKRPFECIKNVQRRPMQQELALRNQFWVVGNQSWTLTKGTRSSCIHETQESSLIAQHMRRIDLANLSELCTKSSLPLLCLYWLAANWAAGRCWELPLCEGFRLAAGPRRSGRNPPSSKSPLATKTSSTTVDIYDQCSTCTVNLHIASGTIEGFFSFCCS